MGFGAKSNLCKERFSCRSLCLSVAQEIGRTQRLATWMTRDSCYEAQPQSYVHHSLSTLSRTTYSCESNKNCNTIKYDVGQCMNVLLYHKAHFTNSACFLVVVVVVVIVVVAVLFLPLVERVGGWRERANRFCGNHSSNQGMMLHR